ncbi:ABC transporter permease [Caldalkalibacillus mannanilyticus]|uniref:ABC transporter permease n=1 Tax=Caldalkalibacillus mannanilyticus TaxID=1418 RepID=UPI0004684CBE|nr:ABC transporter permease [Caldalkalibacillus mannanilyticus]
MKQKGKLLASPALLWLIIFAFLPMMVIVLFSFLSRGAHGQIVYEFTLKNYIRFFEPLYLSIVLETLSISILTTVITLIVAYPLSYYISGLPKGKKTIWLILVMLPFWINFLIRSYAWIIILRSQGIVNTFLLSIGWIDTPLNLLYHQGAVLLGMVYTLLPFMVLPLYVAFERVEQQHLDAAADLGASEGKAFWNITLPLTKPGILNGCVLVFVSSFGMFVVPDVLGGAKNVLLGNLIQNQFLSARDWPFGSASSIMLMGLSLLLIALFYKAMKVNDIPEGRS